MLACICCKTLTQDHVYDPAEERSTLLSDAPTFKKPRGALKSALKSSSSRDERSLLADSAASPPIAGEATEDTVPDDDDIDELPHTPSAGSAAGSGSDDGNEQDGTIKVTIHKQERRDRTGLTLTTASGCRRAPTISCIAADGAAARSGDGAHHLRPGLHLLSVNGVRVKSHEGGTKLLKSAKGDVSLVLAQPAYYEGRSASPVELAARAAPKRKSLAERAKGGRGAIALSDLAQSEVERIQRGLPDVEEQRDAWMSDSSDTSESGASSSSSSSSGAE